MKKLIPIKKGAMHGECVISMNYCRHCKNVMKEIHKTKGVKETHDNA